MPDSILILDSKATQFGSNQFQTPDLYEHIWMKIYCVHDINNIDNDI